MPVPHLSVLRRRPLGLDLQPDRIVLVQVDDASGTLRGYRMSQHARDDARARSDALAEAWASMQPGRRAVCIGVPAERVRFRKLAVPSGLPGRALRDILRAEAAAMSETAPEGLCIGYQALPPGPEARPEREVLLCAADRSVLDALVDTVVRAGLRTAHLQVDLFARLNAWATAGAHAGIGRLRRGLLHLGPHRVHWHVLGPDAWYPETAGRDVACPADPAGHPDLSALCDGIAAAAPDTILLSGPPEAAQAAMTVLRDRLPACVVRANPFTRNALADGPARAGLAHAAPGLLQAWGLALGA